MSKLNIDMKEYLDDTSIDETDLKSFRCLSAQTVMDGMCDFHNLFDQ
jgi:hypothetical protein